MEDCAKLIAHPGGRKTGAALVATSWRSDPIICSSLRFRDARGGFGTPGANAGSFERGLNSISSNARPSSAEVDYLSAPQRSSSARFDQ
jgi:hypothetical protein